MTVHPTHKLQALVSPIQDQESWFRIFNSDLPMINDASDGHLSDWTCRFTGDHIGQNGLDDSNTNEERLIKNVGVLANYSEKLIDPGALAARCLLCNLKLQLKALPVIQLEFTTQNFSKHPKILNRSESHPKMVTTNHKL